ncbi:MAG: heme-binding protein [Desulfovibrio sp.]|nr:heme-binding protein [Desulfovibrio sp.]
MTTLRNALMSILCLLTLMASTAFAAEMKKTLPGDLTLAQAQMVIAAAQAKAMAIKVPMNIAVVDAGGNLKAFARMDDAFLGSIDIATKKAVTARSFNMSTRALGAASQPGQPLYGIEVSNGGLIIFAGGLPLVDKHNVIIGAIGVSGGSVDQDESVAMAGAAAAAR